MMVLSGIDNLPDEVLLNIFGRVSSRPLPVRMTQPQYQYGDERPAWVRDMPVTSTLLCAFVCKRWRALTDAAVVEIAFATHTLDADFHEGVRRFPNLRYLSFKSVTFQHRHWGHLGGLFGQLALNTPGLQTLVFEYCHASTLGLIVAVEECFCGNRWKEIRKLDLGDILYEPNEGTVLRLLKSVCSTPMLEEFNFDLSYYEGHSHWKIWEALAGMTQLRTLRMRMTYVISQMPLDHLTSIVNLTLQDYEPSSLKRKIPESLTGLAALERLHCLEMKWPTRSPPRSVPHLLTSIPHLRFLILEDIMYMHSLPENLGRLSSLEELHLVNCHHLGGKNGRAENDQSLIEEVPHPLPDGIEMLQCLRVLRVVNCPQLMSLPQTLGHLNKLEELCLDGCIGLRQLPDNICELSSLGVLKLSGCRRLASVPGGFAKLVSLRELSLSGGILSGEFAEWLGSLSNLQVLSLVGCHSLEALPESVGRLHKMRELIIENCMELRSLPETLVHLSDLRVFKVRHCASLERLPSGLRSLEGLWEMEVWDCHGLREAPQIPPHLSNFKLVRPIEACFARGD